MQAAQSAAEADGVEEANQIKEEEEAAAANPSRRDKSDNDDDDSDDEDKDDEEEGSNGDASEAAAALKRMGSDDSLSRNPVTVLAAAAFVEQSSKQASSKKKRKKKKKKKGSLTEAKKPQLRRGKWTPEEEAYASRLIQEFKSGLLPLTDGTTLRTFLSKLLNCDPMRISKKFVGANCIGKQIFRRRGAEVNNLTPEEVERTRYELSELEKKFLDRVAQTKGGSSSKNGGGGGSRSARRSTGGSNRGGGGLSTGAYSGGLNKSAAAAGRALLQGNSGSASHTPQANNLFSQLQSTQPGMFDNNILNGAASKGSLGGLGKSRLAYLNILIATKIGYGLIVLPFSLPVNY